MRLTEIDFSVKNLAIAASAVGIIALIYFARGVVTLLLVSVLIAYLLNPLIEILIKFKIPRTVAVFVFVLILVTLIVVFISVALPIIITDIGALIKTLPDSLAKFFAFLQEVLSKFGVDMSFETTKAFLIEKMGTISKYAFSSIGAAAISIKNVVFVIINIVLTPVLVFFLLKDFEKLRSLMSKLVKKFHLENTAAHMLEFESIVGRYFRGMIIDGLVLSVLYTAVLLVVGVNSAPVLGLITGMGILLPYIGFAIGCAITIIMTALQFHDFWHILYVMIGFLIIQGLESTVITPKIVGESLGLNPVLVIVSLIAGGTLFGFIGMIIALPIAAFVKIYLMKKLG